MLKQAQGINVVSILHFEKSAYPVLFFPEAASTFPLNMDELGEFGVERITSGGAFFLGGKW